MDSFNRTGRSFASNRSQQGSQEKVRGQSGATWDARHMTSFLNKSQYSNREALLYGSSRALSGHRKATSTAQHFFKTTKDDKNASKIGFTGINPLVSNIDSSPKRARPI